MATKGVVMIAARIAIVEVSQQRRYLLLLL
jgi:hypothetical protein